MTVKKKEIYTMRLNRLDLKEKLNREKERTGTNIHRLVENILDAHFKKDTKISP